MIIFYHRICFLTPQIFSQYFYIRLLPYKYMFFKIHIITNLKKYIIFKKFVVF